ncbi:MAG: phosphotransferase [Acidobacteriota bacterium]
MSRPAALGVEEAAELEALLGQSIQSAEVLSGGRNSRVLVLGLSDDRGARPEGGRTVVAKRYARRRPPRLDPLDVEIHALRFLADHGPPNVPELLAADPVGRWAVLSEVPGRAVEAADVDDSAVDALLEFLGALDRAGHAPSALDLPPASEASFSLDELEADIRARLPPLRAAVDGGVDGADQSALAYLERELEPQLVEGVRRARQALGRAGVGPADALPEDHRRLSPSDLGFHNARLDLDGGTRRFYFVDFEYFGWDDPAKTLCDLLLHPRALIPPAGRFEIVRRRLAALRGDTTLPHRLRAGYPLFGIKWCLILLNEFLPHARERRRLAGADSDDHGDPRPRQLQRARALLRRLRDEPSPV